MYCLIKSFENIYVGLHSDNRNSYNKEYHNFHHIVVFKDFQTFFIFNTYNFIAIKLKLRIN